MRVEIILPPWLEGNRNSDSIAQAALWGLMAAGYDVAAVPAPSWQAERIVIWGLGHPRAQELLREARGRGVTVIGWDLGYWRRGFRYRVSINDAHPRAYVMARQRPLDRLVEDRIALRLDGDPEGPVYLIGIGQKSAATYGEQPGEWEERALAKIRAAWPDRNILFRAKPGGGPHRPHTIAMAPMVAIESLLRRAAAVYCRHSNVAVDAIIADVPAIAEDGAAAAVCDHEPMPGVLPTRLARETRTTFLGNLAWFQWSEAELREPVTWSVIDDIIRSVP